MTDAVATLSNEKNVGEQFAKISTPTSTIRTIELVSSAPGKDALKDILFGSIAGIAGKIVEYPFDTIKVRLQSQPTTPPFLYSGPWDCFRQSISQSSSSSPRNHNNNHHHIGGGGGGGGIRGLYRGLSAPLFGAAIETSSLFFSYRLAQTLLRSSGFFLLLPSSTSSTSSTSSSSSFSSVKIDNNEKKISYDTRRINDNKKKKQNRDGDEDERGGGGDDGSRLPLGALVACGAASGAFTSLLLTPIELVKCQMQVPSPSSLPLSPHNTTTTTISRIPPTATATATTGRPPGPISIIATIYRHHGLLGFWHGQLATCIRETGGSAAWFGVYEAVSAFFRSRSSSSSSSSSTPFSSSSSSYSSSSFSSPSYSPTTTTTVTTTNTTPLPIWQQMTAGACAGVSYIFGFFPADTIKSRMQTEAVVVLFDDVAAMPTTGGGGGGAGGWGRGRIGASSKKVTFWECARIVWREQGIKGLYRGCGITVARAAPSSAFIFAIYEGLKGAF